MKKLIIGTFLIIFALCGCSYTYCGPEDNADEIWISTGPNIYFVYSESEKRECGAIKMDSGIEEILVDTSVGNEIGLYRYTYPKVPLSDDKILVTGALAANAANSRNMHIYQSMDSLFNAYEKICFTIYNISEVEWVDGWPVPIEG